MEILVRPTHPLSRPSARRYGPGLQMAEPFGDGRGMP
jgi:hypothetical protein